RETPNGALETGDIFQKVLWQLPGTLRHSLCVSVLWGLGRCLFQGPTERFRGHGS
ncbi:unnamed protein product, partial [Gulo gulo]